MSDHTVKKELTCEDVGCPCVTGQPQPAPRPDLGKSAPTSVLDAAKRLVEYSEGRATHPAGYAALERELGQFFTEVNASRFEINSRDDLIKILEGRVKNLHAEVDERIARIKELARERDEARECHRAEQADYATLKKTLDETTAAYDAAVKVAMGANTEAVRLQNENNALKAENLRPGSELQCAITARERLIEENSVLRGERDNAVRAGRDLIAVIDRDGGHTQAGEKFIDSCERAETAVASMIVQRDELKKKLDRAIVEERGARLALEDMRAMVNEQTAALILDKPDKDQIEHLANKVNELSHANKVLIAKHEELVAERLDPSARLLWDLAKMLVGRQ